VEELGPWGVIPLAALFLPACVLLLPSTPIGLACGFFYGFGPGFAAVVLFSNLGAQAAFLIGRRLFHERVRGWVARSPGRRAIERAVTSEGARVVLLLRLSPLLPFNFLNYALSASRIPFPRYALATFLGMLPGTARNIAIAAAVGRAGRTWTGEVETGLWSHLLVALGVVTSVVAVVLVTRKARHNLNLELAREELHA
jgi:uncharacterized membrane protein YdjX (TVP38/TMEM64 family)